MTEQIIEGVRMYIDETGRQFIADQYDRLMKPAHGLTMKKDKRSKGTNPDRTKLWMKGEKSYR